MRRLPDLGERLRRVGSPEVAAVLAVTVSVQGLIVLGQFLIAFLIKPEQLGLIRWLESAFAIALLATSCGMPSVAFREAALCTSAEARIQLIAQSAVLTSATVTLLFLVASVAYISVDRASTVDEWAVLIPMAGVLWPANIARIGVAMVQGGQLSKVVWPRLLVFSGAGVGLLCGITWLTGVKGWVTGRFVIELGLALLVVHTLVPQRPRLHLLFPDRRQRLRDVFLRGSSANFAFLIRAVSDNLPILLLRATLGAQSELGWYGFASLAIFLPTLLLSVLMQAKLPGLIQSVHNHTEFRKKQSRAQTHLLIGAVFGSCLLFGLAIFLHRTTVLANYAAAALPLLILGLSLPFRALILSAGAATVAHGRYAISSVLALAEIFVVLVVWFFGAANTATEMAVAVFGASALSVLPALSLIRYCRGRTQ